jgi:histidinol-phosphatase
VQGVDGPFGGSALVSNGRLHHAALQVLDPLLDD